MPEYPDERVKERRKERFAINVGRNRCAKKKSVRAVKLKHINNVSLYI